MRTTAVTIVFICIALCGLTEPSRAELHFQSRIESACRPAAPVTQTLLRWRSTCANNDCFAWRLTCSNGKTYNMQSKIHPATTELQNVFYEWAPWSFVLFLLPFLIYAGLAVVGSEFPALLATVNAGFVTYALCAAWALYSSIAGDPWGPWTEAQHLLFLNLYVYGAIVIGVRFAQPAISAARLRSLLLSPCPWARHCGGHGAGTSHARRCNVRGPHAERL